jgi:hypothetical protein
MLLSAPRFSAEKLHEMQLEVRSSVIQSGLTNADDWDSEGQQNQFHIDIPDDFYPNRPPHTGDDDDDVDETFVISFSYLADGPVYLSVTTDDGGLNENGWCDVLVPVAPFSDFMTVPVQWDPIIQKARRLAREAYDLRTPNF